MAKAKHFLVFLLLLQLGIPGYSQTKNPLDVPSPDDAIQNAQNSSKGINWPSRREFDVGVLVLGLGVGGITRLKIHNEKTEAADEVLLEKKSKLYREAPQMTAARQKYEEAHKMRTFNEAKDELAAKEKKADALSDLAGVENTKTGAHRIYSDEDIKAFRDAEARIRAGLQREKANLVTTDEKNELIAEAKKELDEAQKIEALRKDGIQSEIDTAQFQLDQAEAKAWKGIFRFKPRYYYLASGILVLYAGWDLIRSIGTNTVSSRIATPEELSQLDIAMKQEPGH